MPRLSSDPNLSICPDYAEESIDEDQAIIILRNIWLTGNNADKAQWQNQVEEDAEHCQHLERLHEEERERQDQDHIDEDEAAHKEDRKKNKFKYTSIPSLDVPMKPVIIPSAYAICKLDKGGYVELWYFTNAGLDDAKLKSSVDEDAMAMEDASWPDDRITMMAKFWRNLQVHDFHSMRNPLAQKSLLVYQAEQRKCWHMAVKTAAGAYDLSRINEILLERMRNDIYLEERKKQDNQHDYKVSARNPYSIH
ncbi:uncharacterized protein EDB93DRAFT_1270814 [Suillus bovinus]|uniref:uncharacterized protein n=1 Tax=Suillus bovinus TaxID=48563 RepID=UPI001B8780CE|nr:uncharacterized protein EDB93DRAFT_1270814 [Suillus bovinus]KAG2153796.1 hypothetical protein EDB93DRAFT_1270814 [Suillus bovinus]